MSVRRSETSQQTGYQAVRFFVSLRRGPPGVVRRLPSAALFVVDEAAEAIATLQALSRSTRRRDRARQAVTLLAQRFTIVIRERCFNGAI